MAKLQHLSALVALFLLAAFIGVSSVPAPPKFLIQGRVYCDTCRAGFETSATEYLEGAKVKVECKNYATGEIVQTTEGETDETGTYSISVPDDHQEETCEVVLVKSPLEGCSEIKAGRDRARILLTRNVGIATDTRYANSLGFLKDEPLGICGKLLMQYALGDDE